MFEEQVQKALFNSQNEEKSFIDKILAKEDVNRIKDLMRKPQLTREDVLELLYLASGNETKLLNYGEWDRYIQLKFFVWLREFIKIAELLYDYHEKVERDEKEGKTEPLTKRTKQLFKNNELLIQHNAKFLIDLYFNMGRSTLSLGATGIMELLKTRFEFVYPNASQLTQGQEQSKSLFNFGGKNR